MIRSLEELIVLDATAPLTTEEEQEEVTDVDPCGTEDEVERANLLMHLQLKENARIASVDPILASIWVRTARSDLESDREMKAKILLPGCGLLVELVFMDQSHGCYYCTSRLRGSARGSCALLSGGGKTV